MNRIIGKLYNILESERIITKNVRVRGMLRGRGGAVSSGK